MASASWSAVKWVRYSAAAPGLSVKAICQMTIARLLQPPRPDRPDALTAAPAARRIPHTAAWETRAPIPSTMLPYMARFLPFSVVRLPQWRVRQWPHEVAARAEVELRVAGGGIDGLGP